MASRRVQRPSQSTSKQFRLQNSAYLPSRQITLQYQVCGDADAPHRAVLVMGIFTPGDEWEFVVQALLRRRSDLQVRFV